MSVRRRASGGRLLIRVRYGQAMQVNGWTYGPPEKERGVERLPTLYHRSMQDIFGRA